MSWRITTIIRMASFAIALFGLYIVKYTVADVQREVATAQQDLQKEKDSLHLLNAEWAYLNRPQRLEKLAAEHLQLSPLDSRRIEDIQALPAVYEPDASAAESEKGGLYHPTADIGAR